MPSDNSHQVKQGEDNRAVWERPALRRLATKYAEGSGSFHDEGNPPSGTCAQGGTGSHSCKNA